VLVKHLVAHIEGFQEHQPQQHAQIPLQLGIIECLFSADGEESLDSFYEGDYDFVVDIVELPELAIGVVAVVVVLEGMLLDVVDV